MPQGKIVRETVELVEDEHGWLCPVCGNHYPTERGLRAHLGREHNVRGPSNSITVSIDPGDYKLIEYIQEQLSTSKSDAIRSSIRAFAMSLQRIERRSE